MLHVALHNKPTTDMTEIHIDNFADKLNESLQLLPGTALTLVDLDELDGMGVEDDVADLEVDLLVLEALDAVHPPAITNILED